MRFPPQFAAVPAGERLLHPGDPAGGVALEHIEQAREERSVHFVRDFLEPLDGFGVEGAFAKD